MTTKQEILQNRLGPEIEALKQQCQTILLATVDKTGNPNVSYAPFVIEEGEYRVLISTIARHARNLLENPKVSLMLIEDEHSCRQIFARRRLSFDATVRELTRYSSEWLRSIEALKTRHGNLIDELSRLEDFKLFAFKPETGLFVKGFGQAFQVSSHDLVSVIHLDQGHIREE
ncbi:heme utilization protein HutZ [Conservatibacter flavescens]|uniref:Heme utilization protein HutZ n=1 Tax=Conservatibacter flavescens TaxID=28161 RepID=A0A2M8RZA8_9PAST|nr:heme utilization protein HutZ [Conservatibacter flavescens]PJG84235.1 heme utilization protein HutZ [Conservatibacter flavescens]